MTAFCWLASYPKSGNTWFRLLVANLQAESEPVDINDMPEREGIASGRAQFEHATLIDSGLLAHDEADRLRPLVYREMAAKGARAGDAPGPRLVKVHDAYRRLADGTPLLAGRDGARRAIVIVRDPRAIAPSLAQHHGRTIDEAIDFMADPAAALAGGLRSQPQQLRQVLLDWSGHAASWLDQADLPVHRLRYEDLAARPAEALQAAMAFAGRPVERRAAERAAEFASFARLQAQEREKGFCEWVRPQAGLFFRRGEAAGWRAELTPAQVRRLEAAHGAMMARLGYEPIGQAA